MMACLVSIPGIHNVHHGEWLFFFFAFHKGKMARKKKKNRTEGRVKMISLVNS